MEQPELIGGPKTQESSGRVIKPSGRKKLLVFLVSLLLSGLMWIYIELMKDYTTDLEYSLVFTHVPEDLMLVNRNDSTIRVGVTAQGFELLEALYLKKTPSLEIDLSELRIRQSDGGFKAYLPSSALISQIGRQLGSESPVSYVKPDTLFFRFAEVSRLKVPVLPDLIFNFSQQYLLYDSLAVEPAYITVTSIKEVTDTLKAVYTERTIINDIDSSLTIRIPLRKSINPSLLRYTSDSVKVTIPVRKYTEAVYEVPVNIEGNLPVKLFPDKVQLTCMVPMQDYREITENSFKIAVNTGNVRKGDIGKLKAEIRSAPRHVKVTRIKPEELEFIYLSR